MGYLYDKGKKANVCTIDRRGGKNKALAKRGSQAFEKCERPTVRVVLQNRHQRYGTTTFAVEGPGTAVGGAFAGAAVGFFAGAGAAYLVLSNRKK